MAPSITNYEQAIEPLPVKAAFQNGPGLEAALADLKLEDEEKHDLVLRTFRCLIADLCQQFGGGHPGGAMGMAAIGIALWKYVMRYSPSNPDYFNRDRFVLSNGHTCLWQYTFIHLVGFQHMTMEQLKTYHSDRSDSYCPGHPEIEHPGIEVTTGPLGQGITNSVGLAMATKNLQATYNKPGHDVINNHTWCMIGDACLQEGVGMEAIQLAGHWKLNNLTVIYDNNQITCDGSVDVACTEDINAKMRACGWNVVDIFEGVNNIHGLVGAMIEAKASDKPTFINVRTIIGVGSCSAGDAKAHGAAFGVDEVYRYKKAFGFDPEQHFIVPDAVYDFFHEARDRGERYEAEWKASVQKYRDAYPKEGAEFMDRVNGKMPGDWRALIPSKDKLPTAPTATRKLSGLVCNPLAENLNNFMIGTADLSPSVNLGFKNQTDFQNPDLRPVSGPTGNYGGRYIHYGIREHAMAAISNGLAAFNHGTFLPITSSFFMFYIYAAPGIRMGALQHLRAIHIATHDSIGTGEDGPTHQPIELAALYRAMPNFLYIRPCDGEEVAGAYIAALEEEHAPSLLSLSRQNVPQYHQYSSREGVLKGGYVFIDEPNPDVTLIGVGAEMKFAVEARDSLIKNHGLKVRVVSIPCQRLFERQNRAYRQDVLASKSNAPVVVVEAYACTGWERYADAGISMGSFGKSLPGADAYEWFGFNGDSIATRVTALVKEVKVTGLASLRGDFRDLNGKLQ